MFNRLLLLVLKQRLRRYKRDAKWYEKIGNYNNFYHETGIPNLEREIKELKIIIDNPRQRTFCYCPNCNNELISSNSFVSDNELVTYKCTNCNCISHWDFDVPAPILIHSETK
jgi:hypothetical protein